MDVEAGALRSLRSAREISAMWIDVSAMVLVIGISRMDEQAVELVPLGRVVWTLNWWLLRG
jgi:hypothetical protein